MNLESWQSVFRSVHLFSMSSLSKTNGKVGDRTLGVVGLFAGIGGLELGLRRAGHRVLAMCEIEPSARRVLAKHFPGAGLLEDVRHVRSLPRGTDILVAGFPCQDLSQCGRTRGLKGRNSGLVREVFRILETRKVPWVLLENVPFMLNLNGGRTMRSITRRLRSLGYRWAYRVVDSRSFGVPQRRQRVFLVASRVDDPRNVLLVDDSTKPPRHPPGPRASGFYWTEGNTGLGWAENAIPPLKSGSAFGMPSPPAVLMPSGYIVKPGLCDAERLQGFPRHWTRPAENPEGGRAERGIRWRLVGNAVTVPVARWIGGRLKRPGQYDASNDVPLRPKDRWPCAAWGDDGGTYVASASAFPKAVAVPPRLAGYLLCAVPLSFRATSGFYHRVRKSSLRLPRGFLGRLTSHMREMKQREAA
jgi:DNA (cytosine-5)-methyltransferase 1